MFQTNIKSKIKHLISGVGIARQPYKSNLKH